MKRTIITIYILISAASGIFAQDVTDYKKYQEEGRQKVASENYVEAIKDYDKAIQSMPYYSTLYYDRGFAKMQLKDYKGAITDFSIAINKKPHDLSSILQRGIAYYQVKEFEAAVNDLNIVLKYSPTNQDARFYLDESQKELFQIQKEYEEQMLVSQNQQNYQNQQLKMLRRYNRNRIIFGTVLPLAFWTTTWLIFR